MEAWREFTAIYEPFVYRFARRRGLQDADAREVVQEVFLGVSRAVRDWEPDQRRARFRTWLFKIAKNQLLNLLRKRRDANLDSAGWEAVGALAEDDDVLSNREESEYRDEVFRWACARVKTTVKVQNWQAFWDTAVLGRPVTDVAEDLELPRGAVYVARSRVIKKLRDEISQFESESE